MDFIYSFCPLLCCQKASDTYDNFLNGECFGGDVAMMGFHSINYKPSSGVTNQIYYTTTTDEAPFCMGKSKAAPSES